MTDPKLSQPGAVGHEPPSAQLLDDLDEMSGTVAVKGKLLRDLTAEIRTQRAALSAKDAELQALRNLANNLQPGPISEALSGERYTREAELLAKLSAAEAALAASETDARPMRMYYVTAHAMGFVNSPLWHELADETKQLYRDRASTTKDEKAK